MYTAKTPSITLAQIYIKANIIFPSLIKSVVS